MLEQAIEKARRDADPYVEGIAATDEELDASPDLGFFEFHGLELDRCSLRGLKARKASFYDCTLRGCDVSGSDFEEAYFARSRLVGCKLEGTQLRKAFLRTTVLEGCVCRYSNWGEATLEGVRLVECDLREAFMSEVRLRARTRLTKCDLTRADFFRTRLKGMDLSTCNIAGIAVSDMHDELRGMLIAPHQAIDLVGMLGVRVCD